MSTFIIISTHGFSAEQLLLTTEMLAGKQDFVVSINFKSNENIDILIKKYENTVNKLNKNIYKNILFLVDMWGGTPFNAANNFINRYNEKDRIYNYGIISGVNIPMLINLFLSVDEKISFKDLISNILDVSRKEIRSLYLDNLKKEKENFVSLDKKDNMSLSNNNNYNYSYKRMVLSLVRIDDRLIHGQVVTSWIKSIKVDRIIVVNDDISKDIIRVKLLKQVSPPGISAHVVDLKKFVRVFNNPKYSQERVMLLFTNPSDVLNVIQNNVEIKSINIGGMSYKKGKIQISDSISVDKNDIESFKKLSEKGIELEARKIFSDTKINLIDLIKSKIIY